MWFSFGVFEDKKKNLLRFIALAILVKFQFLRHFSGFLMRPLEFDAIFLVVQTMWKIAVHKFLWLSQNI